MKLNTQFIKDYMKENNVSSLNQLATEIGISPSMLWRMMHGQRKPGQKVIQLMMVYFKVEFEKLFCHDAMTKVKEIEGDIHVG